MIESADRANIDEILTTVWRDRIRWSDAAGKLHRKVKVWHSVQLFLAVAGAVLATAAATIPLGSLTPAFAAAGAVALALVPVTTINFLSREAVDRWPRARSVSEGLKSEVFKYRAGAGDYAADRTDSQDTALQHLVARVGEITALGEDIEAYLSPEPSKSDPPPPRLTPSLYLKDRVNRQIESYYRKRSHENLAKAKLFRRLGVACISLAAVLSASGSVDLLPALGAWVAVATTIGTVFATHSAVNQFEALAVSYAKQAGELRQLTLRWQALPDRDSTEAWSAFVVACEEAISTENRAWMARMTEDVKGIDDVIGTATGGGR